MRSHSTPESAHRGEVTELAIVETFAAVALYIWIFSISQGSWRLTWIVVAAPFMLFRTERSADWALRYWQRWGALLDPVLERATNVKDPIALAGLAVLVAYLLITPIVGFLLRVTGAVYWMVRMPLYTVREAPSNWFRQTLCTDFIHLPELVPLEALKGNVGQLVKFLPFMATHPVKISVKILAFVLLSPLLMGYVIAILYRLAFKATALAYAPFIWVAQATTRSPMSLRFRLERITKGEVEKVRRWYSGMVLVAAAARFGFFLGLVVDLKSLPDRFPIVQASEYLRVPGGWWQLTLVGDAVLTWLFLFFADAALARHDSNHPWREQTVLKMTEATAFVRGTLAVLTMAYLFQLASRRAFPGLWHFLTSLG